MDPSLVERAQSGDRDAFAMLASGLSDRLYAVALRILRDGDAAGEALQSTLVLVWRDLPKLREPGRLEAWAYRITVRQCHRAIRRSRREPRTFELQPTDAVVADAQVSISQRDELERAFSRLSADQRAVLVLMYYRGLTVPEIALTLDVAEGTVKSRLHYARRAMRAAIDAGERPVAREGRVA